MFLYLLMCLLVPWNTLNFPMTCPPVTVLRVAFGFPWSTRSLRLTESWPFPSKYPLDSQLFSPQGSLRVYLTELLLLALEPSLCLGTSSLPKVPILFTCVFHGKFHTVYILSLVSPSPVQLIHITSEFLATSEPVGSWRNCRGLRIHHPQIRHSGKLIILN